MKICRRPGHQLFGNKREVEEALHRISQAITAMRKCGKIALGRSHNFIVHGITETHMKPGGAEENGGELPRRESASDDGRAETRNYLKNNKPGKMEER